mmetsp:Transcript_3165/g.13795  ORF Transcript_3165/g.13795 Transcript_3165/m.13795 type:complete len:213 (+) Transcript_3165:2619-3257(+)
MAAPLATFRAFSASSRSYSGDAAAAAAAASAGGVSSSFSSPGVFLGVRLNLGADGPAVLTGGAFWVASRDGAGGAGSSLRFHTALDAGASPVVARSSSSSPSSRSLFFANGGRSKDVLVSTSAMTSSPKEYTTLPSALVVLSTLSLSDAPVGESAAAATTGKARRARRLEEDVMIRARDADDDRPRALARAAPATGGARRAPMAIDEVDMPT